MRRTPWIVLTSINPPTDAVRQFSEISLTNNWNVVVVGDKKTPSNWKCDGVKFLSLEEQEHEFGALSKKIPTGHYSRKNLGYLYAIKNGASLIIDTDDDNLPYKNFGLLQSQQVQCQSVKLSKWINIYLYYSNQLIWPRGLPLNYIHEKGSYGEKKSWNCPIQQFLADEDPDVDAIFRLLYKEIVVFNSQAPAIVLEEKSYCPFNSQNTIFYPDAFPLLFLPCFVSFRMTDIWRSFVAQRVLWENDANLCFHTATVKQVRNPHNLMRDFRDEIDGYLKNEDIGAVLDELPSKGQSFAHGADLCWKKLIDHKYISSSDMEIFELWLEELKNER